MDKLVVTEFVSIAGVFEDPDGAEDYEYGGWTFEYNRAEDGDTFKMDELMEADVELVGRRTYDDLEAVRLTHGFLEAPERYLRAMMTESGPPTATPGRGLVGLLETFDRKPGSDGE